MSANAGTRERRARALDALLVSARAINGRARRPHVLLVSDIGPDPDDAKALLIAATMHRERHIALCGVVANGGHQALQRARLARCVLDHLRLPKIPVGVGTAGKESAPMPHEYALPGYDDVDDARLVPGARLIVDVLRSAPARSVRVVLISSLRDFADVLVADAPLVLRKVHTVAVQGGLEPDASRPSGFRADTSVNNGFDMDAAESVYAFCFAHGVPMTVTSRHAVPMLPMQLARSFAERTSCPVLRYLAAAQFLGLEGLWQRLCAGKLPERCTKQVRAHARALLNRAFVRVLCADARNAASNTARRSRASSAQWYFETFCGRGASAFEEGRFDELDGAADIASHLNGCVQRNSLRQHTS